MRKIDTYDVIRRPIITEKGSLLAEQMSDRALRVTVSTVILLIGIQMFTTASRRIRQDRRELPPVAVAQVSEGTVN